MASEFNPIDYAERLASEGVPANQANVHARALADVLARCTVQPHALMETESRLQADSADFRHHVDLEFVKMRNEVELRFTELRSDIDLRFTKMQASIDVRFSDMQGQINSLQRQLTMLKWMVSAMLTVQIGILLKLFM